MSNWFVEGQFPLFGVNISTQEYNGFTFIFALSLFATQPQNDILEESIRNWPTIQEIVLVNQLAPLVEVWQRNNDDPDNEKAWFYRRSGPGDMVELASLGVQVTIEAFYRGLTFDDGEEEGSSL